MSPCSSHLASVVWPLQEDPTGPDFLRSRLVAEGHCGGSGSTVVGCPGEAQILHPGHAVVVRGRQNSPATTLELSSLSTLPATLPTCTTSFCCPPSPPEFSKTGLSPNGPLGLPFSAIFSEGLKAAWGWGFKVVLWIQQQLLLRTSVGRGLPVR